MYIYTHTCEDLDLENPPSKGSLAPGSAPAVKQTIYIYIYKYICIYFSLYIHIYIYDIHMLY